MSLPEPIQARIEGKTGHTDKIGMSGSSITLFDDCVLKIEDVTPYTEGTVALMGWLEQRIPTPKVLYHEIISGKSYLLMSRIPGRMSCNEVYLSHPQLLVRILAEGIHLLWNTDPTGCPRIRTLPHLLEEARYRVEQGLVDMENVEPETFGEKGFRDPHHLLQWLEAHPVPSVPVLTHGDYCLPNVFAREDRFSGFVDVGDGGIGEKWRDIALCYRSLRHNTDGSYGGPPIPDFDPMLLFQALGIEPDWDQIRYHLLLDELF